MKFTLDRHTVRGVHVECRLFANGGLAGHLVLRVEEGERLAELLESEVLACQSCGSTVRVPRRLVESVKKPACIACHGDLKAVA